MINICDIYSGLFELSKKGFQRLIHLPWFVSSQTETVNWSVKTHTLDEDEMEINEMIIQS